MRKMLKPFSSQEREAGGPWRISGSLLLVLLLVLVQVPPAAAAEYDMTGFLPLAINGNEMYNNVQSVDFSVLENDQAITVIHFKVKAGSYVNFTIYYGTGSSVSGSAETSNVGWIPPTTTSTIYFNGDSSTYSYWDINPEFEYNLAGYGRDDTNQSGFLVYNAGYGSFDNDNAVFMPVGDLANNLIYRVEFTSSVPTDIDITYADYNAVAQSASKNAIESALEWVNLAISIGMMLYGVVYGTVLWLKFFFVDNLLMTVSLYLAITMAFAAGRAKTIDGFFRKFFSDQKKLFEFILGLWNVLVSIIGTFRNIFRI